MGSRYEVEVTVGSASNLKNVNWRNGDLRPYAVLWVDDDGPKCSTLVDPDNGEDPAWDEKVVVPVPKSVNGHVTLQVAQGGDGRWRGHADYGLKGTGVGAFGCGGLPGAGRGNTYATEDECLHAQVVEVLKNLDARAETPRARKLAEAVRAKWPEAPKLTNVRYIRDKTPKPKAAAPGARPLSYGQWLATFRSVYQVEQPRTPGAPVWSKVETDGRLLELFKQYPKLRPSDAARGFVAAAAADDDEGDGDGREWRGA